MGMQILLEDSYSRSFKLIENVETKSLLIVNIKGKDPTSNFDFENVDILFSQQKEFIYALVDKMQNDSIEIISTVRLSNTKILVSFDRRLSRSLIDDWVEEMSFNSGSDISIVYDYFEFPQHLSNALLKLICSCIYEGNQSRLYDLLENIQKGEKLFTKKELEIAFENNEFVAHVHSIFDLKSGKVRSLEVLCRWQHPQLGLLFPGDFIPSISVNDAEIEFDTYMLEAVKDLMFETNLPLSMNINCISLQSESFVNSIIEYVNQYEIGDRLTLELTELTTIESNSLCHDNITKLQSNGILISLDDFGSGLTNLNYLTYLKPNEIKLDKVLLDTALSDDMAHSSLAKQIIRSVVEWVGTMKNVQLVVEGIERIEQLDFLVKSGVAVGQGFIYGKPCRIEDFSHITKGL